jgi:hypothetical protein
MSHARRHYTIDELAKRWGWTTEQIEFQLAAKSLKATTWQGMVDPNETDETHRERARYIASYSLGEWSSGFVTRGTQLVIASEEVERFESENGLTIIPFEAPYLDPENEYYSKELAAAVKLWQAVFGAGGNYDPCAAPRKQIERTLTEIGDARNLLPEAITRIITVVNPIKGGAPKTRQRKKEQAKIK